jgi:hypothetical protein
MLCNALQWSAYVTTPLEDFNHVKHMDCIALLLLVRENAVLIPTVS